MKLEFILAVKTVCVSIQIQTNLDWLMHLIIITPDWTK